MTKKVIAIVLVALIALLSLSACKGDAQKGNPSSAASASEQSTGAGEKNGTTAKSDAEQSESDSKKSDASGKESTTSKQSKKTDGWEQQENGDIIKGDVSVNVVRYNDSSLKAGQALIDQLVEAGMKDAKVLSSEKTEKSIITKVSGMRIGSSEKEFVKFQFVSEGKEAYLVTVIAKSEKDLDTDISYVLSNLDTLAY